ncbi:MAG: hypothetical protein ACHREM_13045 [Polyangiales bacterium]
MRTLFALLLTLTLGSLSGLACSSSSSSTCQSTCDKISACGYIANNFSCAGDCSENGCATCLNQLQCSEFGGDVTSKCGVVCPVATFKPK